MWGHTAQGLQHHCARDKRRSSPPRARSRRRSRRNRRTCSFATAFFSTANTMVSVPRTPTASAPLRTASRAYSTCGRQAAGSERPVSGAGGGVSSPSQRRHHRCRHLHHGMLILALATRPTALWRPGCAIGSDAGCQ